jgi:hypothetical protein
MLGLAGVSTKVDSGMCSTSYKVLKFWDWTPLQPDLFANLEKLRKNRNAFLHDLDIAHSRLSESVAAYAGKKIYHSDIRPIYLIEDEGKGDIYLSEKLNLKAAL